MPFLSEKNKDKLIGGIIGIIILSFGYIANNLFNKKEETPSKIQSDKMIVNDLSDSSNQTNNDINQKIDNKGVLNNDFSKDKKITNQYFQKGTKTKSDSIIINHGFLNQGGQGNTYNQTIKGKEQRHVDENSKSWLLNNLPRNYHVKVLCTMGDAETEILAKEMVKVLKEMNFDVEFGGWSVFTNAGYGRIGVNKIDSLKSCEIDVFTNSPN